MVAASQTSSITGTCPGRLENLCELDHCARYLLRPPLAKTASSSARRARPRHAEGGLARWHLASPLRAPSNCWRSSPRSRSARRSTWYPGPVDLGCADAQRVRFDVLVSPRCRGRLRVISTLEDPLAGQTILIHRARSSTPAPAALAEPASQSFSRGCPATRRHPLSAPQRHPSAGFLDRESVAAQDGSGQRAIAVLTLAFAPVKQAMLA